VEHRDEKLEAALLAADDLAAVSAVYSDWLQERGDALGEHLARARQGLSVEPSRWLGALYPMMDEGAVELDFTAGWVTTARLRFTPKRVHEPISMTAALDAVLTSRLSLPLRRLEVDCRATALTPVAVVDALVRHRARALRVLRLGTRFDTEAALDPAAVERLRALSPGLTEGPETWLPVKAAYAVKVLRAPAGHPLRTGEVVTVGAGYYLPEGTLARRGRYFVLTARRAGAVVRAGARQRVGAALVQPGQVVELELGDAVELDSGLVLSPFDQR